MKAYPVCERGRVTGRSVINETAFHPLHELNAYVTITNHNISYQLPARSLSTFLELLIPGQRLQSMKGGEKSHCPDNSDVWTKASNPSKKTT